MLICWDCDLLSGREICFDLDSLCSIICCDLLWLWVCPLRRRSSEWCDGRPICSSSIALKYWSQYLFSCTTDVLLNSSCSQYLYYWCQPPQPSGLTFHITNFVKRHFANCKEPKREFFTIPCNAIHIHVWFTSTGKPLSNEGNVMSSF